ncbi:NAD(P)H-hydrate dehydratase [Bdellovibrio bacteriovorus]|uniref:ADP-dependent (S)-NAD(P)H-hydrate dehydratase n=1 Tax=Bdellovibrio bacteriovorus TaxID=959 RepID=A0A150WID4_BDEBC|nr:NAD(P)H-hydrate dehydratase [Bdellovibrio bacteriovorus]KYG63358.1 NAD(P)H-hydrate dehydratase [Bdellovibrio bacteriovorus]
MKKATAQRYFLKKHGAKKLLPKVSTSDNKSSRGRSLILAGSSEYPGAGVLAAKAALRTGSGYVTLAQKNIAVSSLENPDFLLCDLNKKSWQEINFDVVLVGPGFGVNSFTAQIIRELKNKQIEKVILDADALTVCANENLFPLPSSWIVTPHTGELARCLKISVEEINADRYKAARRAQDLFQCVVILKGHETLIANRQRIYTNKTGNAALAKSGTGDVLAGILTALRGQGLTATQAAVLGVYIHGATANLWASRKKDLLSMMASDVIEYIPSVLRILRGN